MDANTPFVFVIMPFAREFDWLYEEIRGAGEECGAHVARADKELVTTTIADHVHNQLNKADLVVAVLTEERPDVMYEVGYAVAAGRTILPLIERGPEIPFYFKHQQALVYAARDSGELRPRLAERLQALLDHIAGRDSPGSVGQREVYAGGTLLRADVQTEVPGVWYPESVNNSTTVHKARVGIRLSVRNPRRVVDPGVEYFGLQVTQPGWTKALFNERGERVDPVILPEGAMEHYVRLVLDPVPNLWSEHMFFFGPPLTKAETTAVEGAGARLLLHHYTSLGRRAFPVLIRPSGLYMRGYPNLKWSS